MHVCLFLRGVYSEFLPLLLFKTNNCSKKFEAIFGGVGDWQEVQNPDASEKKQQGN